MAESGEQERPKPPASRVGVADTGIIPLAQLPAAVVTNGAGGVNLRGTFDGNGAGLTNVPGAVPWQVVAGTATAAVANQAYLLTNDPPGTVTLPTTASIGDVVTVSRAGRLDWEVSPGAGQIISVFGDAGQIWTPQNSPATNWTDIASSADGTKLVAGVDEGRIPTSTNSGATWTPRASGVEHWRSLTSSADGVKLVRSRSGAWISTCKWPTADRPAGPCWDRLQRP